MPLQRVEVAPCTLLSGSCSELGQRLTPVYSSIVTTFGSALKEDSCWCTATSAAFFGLEHARDQNAVDWFLCCGLALCWPSEALSTVFLHVLITVAGAGSKLLRRLCANPDSIICSPVQASLSLGLRTVSYVTLNSRVCLMLRWVWGDFTAVSFAKKSRACWGGSQSSIDRDLCWVFLWELAVIIPIRKVLWF